MNYRGMICKSYLSGVGEVTVSRRYYASRGCGCKGIPWDEWSGIPGGHKLTVRARRMVSLAGSGCSFDEASLKLRELCHLPVSDDVIRRVCNEEGKEAGQWLGQASEPGELIRKAPGELECYTDGLHVNTVNGWREMRVSVLARRERAAPAQPCQWAERVLEPPGCRIAWARIAASHAIGASWQRMMKHLGLEQTPRLSVLGDGARWIWDEAAKRFKRIVSVDWVVDVYHVSEHLHRCAQKMFPSGTIRARQWADSQLEQLIALEGPKFIDHLRQERARLEDPQRGQAMDALIHYLSENRDSLWYRTRLAQGLPIGSGLVEGTCKNMIGKRLKLNNARWRVRRAEHMAALRCLHYSQLWEQYWTSKTAALAA